MGVYMKIKPILIFCIVMYLLLMPISQIISADINKDLSDSVINNDINENKNILDAHFFARGFFFGTYEVVEYADFNGIKIYNPSEECTIYAYGYRYFENQREFVKAYMIYGAHFIGYCNNGRVIGFVFGTFTVSS